MGSGQTESGGSSSTESSSLCGGLRFGQKIYFEDGSGSGAGSSKNRVVTGRKSVKCQVEDCKMDLINAKTYYSRHKVCCIHSKSSKVIVSGLLQRFCQQCSRFHQLSEFDLEKRSCRRRLACHNERRRKPQPTTTLSFSGNANTAMIRTVLGDSTRSVMPPSGPWRINPEKESHDYSNGNPSFSITSYPEMMNTYNSRESSCALSLLSNSNPNQQQFQTPWRPYMAHSPPVSIQNQYLNQTWEFIAGEKSNSHVLGQSQISESAEFQMSGFELRQYLEPENTRDYESSPHLFNWSL